MTAPYGSPIPGSPNTPTPESTAEIHKVDDVDTSSTAHHHTLGIQPNQSSPGSHRHDGRDSVAIPGAPVGAITMYAAAPAPDGWLLCDGSAVSRTNYAALYGVIGTQFGIGDGSSTFNLPNFVQRVPLGVNGGTNPMGQQGGAYNHGHYSSSPSHSHSGPSHSHSDNGHSHSGTGHSHSDSGHAHSQSSHSHTVNAHSHTVNAHNHGKADEALSHRHSGVATGGGLSDFNNAGLHGHTIVSESPGTSSSFPDTDSRTPSVGTGFAASSWEGTGAGGTGYSSLANSGTGLTGNGSVKEYDTANNQAFLAVNFIIKT